MEKELQYLYSLHVHLQANRGLDSGQGGLAANVSLPETAHRPSTSAMPHARGVYMVSNFLYPTP